MTGPLTGIRIIEFSGIGPGPFCGMMLADHGAEVIRIDRKGTMSSPDDVLGRSKSSIVVNLKAPDGVALVKELIKTSDGLIEGYRPGVMERLGLGPDGLLEDNPNLVYGRMTGWGQTGPLAQAAGHDINYIALSGALHSCGRANEKPTPPVNYLGDFGGGAMMLAFGMVAALLAIKNGAKGQVVDCAMTDGSAILTAMTWTLLNTGMWKDERGVNFIDTGAHYYDTYETSDNQWISIGAIEPQFYALLLEKTGLSDDPLFAAQHDQSAWPDLKDRLTELFKMKTRDEWCAIMEGTDVCFAPVLSMREAPDHPHNQARETFTAVDGAIQPTPAPRFDGTVSAAPKRAPALGADTHAILAALGQSDENIAALEKDGVIGS